jgi:hypothetical protein
MLNLSIVLAQAGPSSSELASAWEIAKGLMLAIGAAGALGVFRMRDDVREIKQELFGRDGTNGMRSVVRRNADRLDLIERRHVDEDAAERERERYEGDERRHIARRQSDLPPTQERSA